MLNIKKIQATVFALLLTLAAMAQDEKKNGNIALQMNDTDTTHIVNATVIDVQGGLPLKDVELTFYVQRTFGLMKVGEGTTDSTGITTAEFPKDIRADDNGKLVLVAKVEDNDVINDTAFKLTLNPDLARFQNKPIPRAMYARHAPWWLVITFTALMAVVWLLFVYILTLVKRIRNAGAVSIHS